MKNENQKHGASIAIIAMIFVATFAYSAYACPMSDKMMAGQKESCGCSKISSGSCGCASMNVSSCGCGKIGANSCGCTAMNSSSCSLGKTCDCNKASNFERQNIFAFVQKSLFGSMGSCKCGLK